MSTITGEVTAGGASRRGHHGERSQTWDADRSAGARLRAQLPAETGLAWALPETRHRGQASRSGRRMRPGAPSGHVTWCAGCLAGAR